MPNGARAMEGRRSEPHEQGLGSLVKDPVTRMLELFWHPVCTRAELASTPDGPLPVGRCAETFAAALAYDLVWVRLDAGAATTIPANPAWDEPAMHVVAGKPYTWPTSALRRVENFVDLAHFPWVHDGTLGRRDEPVPPSP